MARSRTSPKVRQWLITLLSAALLGVLGAGAVAAYLPTQFTAQTTLFVYGHPGDSPEGGARAEELALYRVRSYTPLITDPSVMSEVAQRLGLAGTPQQLAARTEVENPLDTVLINISVTDSSPEQAATISNTIGDVFIETINQLERPQRFDVPQHVAVKVAEPALAPTYPSSLPLRIVLTLGLLAGLAVGTVVMLGLERMTNHGGSSQPIAKAHEADDPVAESRGPRPGSPLLKPIASGDSSANGSPPEAATPVAESENTAFLDPISSGQIRDNGTHPGSSRNS